MNHSESINEIAAALSKAQGVMKAAAKDADNPFFKSKYADLPSVVFAVKQPLADNGLSYVQSPSYLKETGMVTVDMLLMHSSGQWIAGSVQVPTNKGDAQGVGSAITYARRYILAAMLGVVADEDDDGNKAVGNGVQKTIAVKPVNGSAPIPNGVKSAAKPAGVMLNNWNGLYALLDSEQTIKAQKMQTEKAPFADVAKALGITVLGV